MEKSNLKNILTILLVAATVIVVAVYILSLHGQISVLQKQKLKLAEDLQKETALTLQLTNEKARLKDYARASKKKILRLSEDYSSLKSSSGELESKFSLLQAENLALRQEKEKILEENEAMKARLGSAAGFKKAVRDLTTQIRKVSLEIKHKLPPDKDLEGNLGFVVKDGKTTLPAKVRIEVVPAPAN